MVQPALAPRFRSSLCRVSFSQVQLGGNLRPQGQISRARSLHRGQESEHTRIAVGQGVCGTAVAENADQNVADVRARENYLACSLETRSELVVLVEDRKGKILGQIDIDSHTPNAFGAAEESAVKKVANELGELWPA